MGSEGTEWETNDTLSVERLNQKEVYIGGSAPSSPYAGMFWFDSTLSILYQRNAANDDWFISDEGWFTVTETASDDLQHSNDAEATSTVMSGEWEMLKEIKFNLAVSAFRVKYQYKRGSGTGTVYTKLTKNTGNVGTPRSTSETSYQDSSDDLTSFAAGDYLRLHGYVDDDEATVTVQNLRIYFTLSGRTLIASASRFSSTGGY